MTPTILVAPASFKGTLSPSEAGAAMERGIRMILPDAEVILHPVSDGGEGLLDVLVPATGCSVISTVVSGPLPGQRVKARWGISSDGSRAVLEMAEASGLGLVPEGQRDPLVTTTFGLGELMLAALDRGARELIIGIGGSATNDGGAGMAAALGVGFFDEGGAVLPPGGGSLNHLASIDASALDPRLRTVSVIAACDVTSLLTGPAGAARLYAPQKGGSAGVVEELESALLRYGEFLRANCGIDIAAIPGSGAAGGLGAGLMAFCGAKLVSGIDVVLEATGFDRKLGGADLVLTGEGRIDAQTRCGKALAGILRHANNAGVPVAAIVGSMEGNMSEFIGAGGFIEVASLVDARTDVGRAMSEADAVLTERTASLIERLKGHVL